MESPPEKPRTVKLRRALQDAAANPASEDFWDALFAPLRETLIAQVKFHGFAHHTDDAEELADETITRVFQYFDFSLLAGLPPEESNKRFRAFLKSTLFSATADLARQRYGRRLPGTASHTASPRSTVPSTWIVTTAFRRLPEPDQRLLKLKIIDRLTYAEIRDHYAVEGVATTESALKMRGLRAMDQLKRELARLWGG